MPCKGISLDLLQQIIARHLTALIFAWVAPWTGLVYMLYERGLHLVKQRSIRA